MRALLLPGFALFAACLAVLPARAVDAPPPRTIAVTGQGEVKAPPDLAVISFAVETTAPTAGAAVAENARKSTALADELKRQLGDTGKVSTTRYSVDPVYEQRERGADAAPPRITGYIVRNQVRAETRAIDTVGKLIDAAITAGANSVDGLEFTLKERAAAQNDALQRAGQDARRQADAAATRARRQARQGAVGDGQRSTHDRSAAVRPHAGRDGGVERADTGRSRRRHRHRDAASHLRDRVNASMPCSGDLQVAMACRRHAAALNTARAHRRRAAPFSRAPTYAGELRSPWRPEGRRYRQSSVIPASASR